MKKPYIKPMILRKEKMRVVFAACNMDPPTIENLCIGLACPTSCYQGVLVSSCSVTIGPCNSSFEQEALMKECLKVTGDCMYPLLQEGDEVLIEPDSRIKMGDVIVFLSNGFLQIHRALLVLPNGWILQKADRLSNYSWIRKEVVVSQVRFIRRENFKITIDTLRSRLKGLLSGYKAIVKKNLTKTA